MTDEQKGALEQPEVVVSDAIQTAPDQMNPREAIEAAVIAKNAETYTVESEETEAPPTPKKDAAEAEQKPEESSNPSDRVKAEMLKRINKVTARAKSAEERLAELEAENQRLRESKESKEVVAEVKSTTTDKREPTMEECEAALEKAFSEGDHKFAAQVTKYMAELTAKSQRAEAEKALSERSTKQSESQKKQLADWTTLCRDYEPIDSEGKADLKHPLNLSNQNGLLYKTALDLFQDKDLKVKYSGYDPITGFRLAVNDAYRGIIEQGLYKPARETAKVVAEEKVVRRQVLAEPDSDGDDSTPSQVNTNLSDADKVREEIKDRQRNRFKRPLASR
jgi:hypothetical protein